MTEKQTVLVNGYGPFGNYRVNPAWETARSLDGKTIVGAVVKAIQLPVNVHKNKEIMQAVIDEY